MNNKQKLGQFYTTNYKYILQNLNIPYEVKNIIEPFAGNGDLLNFIENKKNYNIECYDIEPKKDFIIRQDTLLHPPNYNNKFVLTNPPYLARNKSKNKLLFDKYLVNDLYKCFIKTLIETNCIGGIMIIPLNFWSSTRKMDVLLRKLFLQKYNIVQLNIFEEQVFHDTSYTVCAFQFQFNDNNISKPITITIYPINKKLIVNLSDNNKYIIGGEIYFLKQNLNYKVSRLTSKNCHLPHTNILVKCIDDNKINKINLSFVSDDDIYIDTTPKLSARTYASLLIVPKISVNKQKLLVKKFNFLLNDFRIKYNSLFLPNYRESKDIARKRISFDLVYSIIRYLLLNKEFI